MYRFINYLFGFAVIYLFILEAGMNDHAMIFTGLFLSAVVAYVSFFGNWITLDATKGVIVLGTIVLGFGGWIMASAIIFFFATGSLLTRYKRDKGIPDADKKNNHPHLQKRRDGYQVWANGFWLAVFCIFWFLFGSEAFLVAGFATIATATADTWATELGMLKPGITKKITTFEPVEPGTDGGISLYGSLAAVLGAAMIASFVFMSGMLSSTALFFIVFLFGLIGCLADSVLGAIFSDKNITLTVPGDYSGSRSLFANSFVNWTSTGLSGNLAFIFTYLFVL